MKREGDIMVNPAQAIRAREGFDEYEPLAGALYLGYGYASH